MQHLPTKTSKASELIKPHNQESCFSRVNTLLLAKVFWVVNTLIMKSYPMQINAQQPYFIDSTYPELDGEGFALEEVYDIPTIFASRVRRWMNSDVLGAILDRQVAGAISTSGKELCVQCPAGDLYVRPNGQRQHILLTRFVTADTLRGQAEEYKLYIPSRTRDYLDTPMTLDTVERGGHALHASFTELQLMDRDPVSIRLAEMIELIRATTTPSVGVSQAVYQAVAA
ncbi:MAG: hypothetical protein JWM81_257 [Candidatus Saccharibacteria bacterium]|nr:hypothetical protein [Candidatus Saccharibacteria bacterium]